MFSYFSHARNKRLQWKQSLHLRNKKTKLKPLSENMVRLPGSKFCFRSICFTVKPKKENCWKRRFATMFPSLARPQYRYFCLLAGGRARTTRGEKRKKLHSFLPAWRCERVSGIGAHPVQLERLDARQATGVFAK